MANLYLISQEENTGHDTFDSAVVVAETEDEAKDMNPSCLGEYSYLYTHFIQWDLQRAHGEWATKRENVNVKFLGEATALGFTGVVCASFNAG